MGAKSQDEKQLTDYESQQVATIAAWKAAFPNPFGELLRRTAQPLAKAIENVIPDRVALASIEAAYKAAELAATRGNLKRQAGVKEIADLLHQPLEVCDRLSRRVGTSAQGIATVEGALTGAGGLWTTVLDIPLLFTLCLRTIIKIGHCYGYPLDRPTDKAWVLGAFAVALSSTKQKRTAVMARLREIEDLLLEQTQEQVVVEEAAALMTQIGIFEDIPVFGAATGALLNLSMAHKTEGTARRLFQERWFRDNGKVDGIDPAPVSDKIPSLDGWSGALHRAGYRTMHNLGFTAAFPFCVAAAIAGSINRPLRTKSPTPDSVENQNDAQPRRRNRTPRKRRSRTTT